MPQPPSADAWDACPPGELSRMAGEIRTRRRRRFLGRVGMVAMALLVGASLGVLWSGWRQVEQDGQGNIACSEVRQLAPRYLAGTLDAELTEKVRRHLSRCAHCSRHMEQMRQNTRGLLEPEKGRGKAARPGPAVVALLR